MDRETLAELAAINYVIAPNEKVQIESKDAVRSALGRSPDLADGFVLAIGGAVMIERWSAAAQELREFQLKHPRMTGRFAERFDAKHREFALSGYETVQEAERLEDGGGPVRRSRRHPGLDKW